MLDKALLESVVREVLREMLTEEVGGVLPGKGVPPPPEPPPGDAVCKPRAVPRTTPFDDEELRALKASTPARLAQGRTGTRYLTHVYVGLRAEHAIALDAVHSTVPPALPKQLGCVELKTRCKDHAEFLLYPDQGRRLDDESRAKLEREGTRGADVVVICGDGLSAWALEHNGPALVPALVSALQAQGFKVGKPVFVQHARVGVQDEIGVILGAKATVILVGERPGLGTGDSLSIYTAYGPKLGQDNAEKDCISNIRPLGIPPVEAAHECATLLKRTFAAGGGGVHLTRSGK
ncbi:MAG: ethanolamine ammonia-lyase subunit EutC [Myxococcota bacterium]